MSRNRNKWILVSAILVALALMQGTSLAKDKEKKAFIAKEYSLGILDPGTTTVEGGIIHIRDQVMLAYYDSTDPRLSGYFRMVVNYNMDSPSSGLIWGTGQSSDASGTPIPNGWVGTFNGRVYSASYYNMLVNGVAHGIGTNKGWRYELTSAWDLVDLNAVYGAVVGLIRAED